MIDVDLHFVVFGVPAPQGSKTRMPNGAVVEGSSSRGRAAHKAWRGGVAEAASVQAATHGQITGPTHLTLLLRFPRPQSRPKSHHGWHTVRPDKDKVLRACLDGLKDGGLLKDDSLVCSFSIQACETSEWTGAEFRLRPA